MIVSRTLSVDLSAFTGPAPLVGENPDRVSLLIKHITSGSDFFVWPTSNCQATGIRPDQGADHILLHRASYPASIKGTWYVMNFFDPNTYEVIEEYEIPEMPLPHTAEDVADVYGRLGDSAELVRPPHDVRLGGESAVGG